MDKEDLARDEPEVFGQYIEQPLPATESHPPLQLPLLEVIEITVPDAEKRTSTTALSMKDTYVVYLIQTQVINDDEAKKFMDGPCSLWRRYSEFELLRNYLLFKYPHVVVPPLPEKTPTFTWQKSPSDKLHPDFIDRRRAGLETFLHRLAAHPELSSEPLFLGLLTQEEGWQQSVNATGFQGRVDTKLRAVNALFGARKPDQRFEDLKVYCSNLETNITNLLKIRAKMLETLYGIHNIHTGHGLVFSEWSTVEKDMGDELQAAGHHMDMYAAYLDAALEEEEEFADRLKEYLYYADAIRCVCRKHEMLQHELEKAENLLAARGQEKERLLQGKVGWVGGIKNRMFGSGWETPEQKESRLQEAEDNIMLAEEEVLLATNQISAFAVAALEEVERFKQQKNKDIKDILNSYIDRHINMCKKGKQIWYSAKSRFEKL